MSDDILLCRCSDLDLDYIRDLISQGFTTIDELKRVARLGMGPCQGRTCIPLVMRELAAATGTPIENVLPDTTRPPVKSIQLNQIVRSAERNVKVVYFHD